MHWNSNWDSKIRPIGEDGRRAFLGLVEVDRDDKDEVNGGWVTFDSYELGRLGPGPFGFFDNKGGLAAFRASFKAASRRFPNLTGEDGGWVLFEASIQLKEEALIAEVILFGDIQEQGSEPPLVGISRLEIIPEQETGYLKHYAMLTGEKRSPAWLISAMLNIPLQDISTQDLAVAVYDVGQGNCNALVDGCARPRIFYDYGWAPNFHAKSRPAAQPSFHCCDFGQAAPVVLSHWDMDHWCYAIKKSTFNPGSLTTRHEWRDEALQRFWIARRPKFKKHQLGPLSQSFYRALRKSTPYGNLRAILLWPDKLKRVDFDAGWLEACEAPPGALADRNNSGIAMFVRQRRMGPAILLPGDADFPSIPSLRGSAGSRLAGLVAPHHGARVTPGCVPDPMSGSPSRLVISVGKDNSYGHPREEAIREYLNRNWELSSTQDRVRCTEFGAWHADHMNGNTLLKFENAASDSTNSASITHGHLCLRPSEGPFATPVPGKSKASKKAKESRYVGNVR